MFKHYHWRELPLDYIRLLHDVARKLPAWDDAVEMINTVMLERHERRVLEHHNRSPLIGEHSRRSKIQDHRSPMQRRDVSLILERLDKTSSPMQKQRTPEGSADQTTAIPIKSYGLEKDDFGMIVPSSAPGVICQTESPCSDARKRRKLASPSIAGLNDTENQPTTLATQQLAPVSASATDSEITEFEDDTCDGTIDEDTNCGPGGSDNNRSECSIDSVEYTTPGNGADSSSVYS